MAANEKNYELFDYVDDNGFHWCVKGESGGAGSAVDGHAAFVATNPMFGKVTTRRHPRYVVAQNPANFRTIRFIVYTAAAYAAIAGGTTIAVDVPGSGTAVDYTVSAKIGEKMPIAKASRNLAD
jgi:hypothetical protein